MLNIFSQNNCVSRAPFGLSVINFIVQRIFRVNGRAPIPVHFTSRVTNFEKIYFIRDDTTLLSFSVSGGLYMQAVNGISIGRNFLFAQGVKIVSANHDLVSRNKHASSDPIVIGSDVWLGANVVILPGVKLADGVVVGAGSVVTSSFGIKNSIIAGNPAELITHYDSESR